MAIAEPPRDPTFRDVYKGFRRRLDAFWAEPKVSQSHFRPIKNRAAAEVVSARLDAALQAQATTVDAVDAKLGLFASVGIGIIGILLAVLALRAHEGGSAGFGLVWSLVALLLLLLAAAYGLLPNWWSYGPRPEVVARLGQDGYSGEPLLNGVLKSMTTAFEFNEVGLKAKVRALRAVYVLLALELVGLVVALVPLALSGPGRSL
jgi:hypothetical protein